LYCDLVTYYSTILDTEDGFIAIKSAASNPNLLQESNFITILLPPLINQYFDLLGVKKGTPTTSEIIDSATMEFPTPIINASPTPSNQPSPISPPTINARSNELLGIILSLTTPCPTPHLPLLFTTIASTLVPYHGSLSHIQVIYTNILSTIPRQDLYIPLLSFKKQNDVVGIALCGDLCSIHGVGSVGVDELVEFYLNFEGWEAGILRGCVSLVGVVEYAGQVSDVLAKVLIKAGEKGLAIMRGVVKAVRGGIVGGCDGIASVLDFVKGETGKEVLGLVGDLYLTGAMYDVSPNL
jgi:hypothetical protein